MTRENFTVAFVFMKLTTIFPEVLLQCTRNRKQPEMGVLILSFYTPTVD